MSRFKLLAAVALLGIPLAACEEATPPPPVGSIAGTVSIEGTGIDGVSVNLSNGNSTTTAGGGSYRFDNVEGGAYTVTISGFPSDATFDATSAAATISSAGQSVTVNFSGAYIRTASVMGSVTVENMGLPGVTVTLSGVSGATATTDDSGQYAFTGLRMGSYSVEISGFDNDEVGFSNTAASVSVGVGESKIVSFDGTYLRTAGIMGRVSVEGEGLEGVTVSLAGGPDNADMTTMTDAAGQYSFAKLRAGDYAVGISGYDTDDYEFEATSQNVTVALGETANVPFEGVLLRTSGVSGRVSVEGQGLEGVMVTLSMADADDMTAMTDAGGLYAFAGLAAGDYTVAIALSDEQMAAYVFDMTSMDVTVGDDETAIVNFEATHAATASVTVQLFIDELDNNDMHDEGEMAFPTPEMLAMVAELGLPLALPVSLAGPGVHDMQQGMVTPTGAVVFAGLKAGQYQVIVTDIPAETLAALPAPLAHALRDYAYGGPATGYPLDVAVGQQAMQYAPIDITHTTVHFGVTLKGGDTRGMPLPGAMVTLYSDAMGETKIGEGMTMVDEETMHAVASIRVARAGTSGNMVYAGASAEGYYDDGEMTAVTWDPQKTYTQGANDNNILNLNVDVSVSGATIMTEAGGGEPLGGWAISIAHGDVMEADTLDEDGMASFKMELPEAVLPLLPKAFTFSVDSIQDDDLDGGEMVEATSFEYMHTGLSLMGTVEGALEAEYTTQTLVVSVYREVDQVPGFTGNIGTGDLSTTCIAYDDDDDCVTGVELELRHETSGNRRNSIDPAVWRWDTSGSDRTVWVDKGVYTFKHLPTDLNLFVLADEIGHVEIVPADNLAAYENLEDNGVEGGAFGSEGGFSHTVSLCPGRKVDPTGQDHGDCGSFGFVPTHTVAAHVKKMIVETDNDDGFKAERAINVTGVEIGLTPTTGKNIAGEAESLATLKSAVRSAGEGSSSSAWDDEVDERQDLYFGRMAEGVYGFSLSSNWAAYLNGSARMGKEYRLKADDVMDVTDRTGADGPFRPGDDSEGVYIEVRPTTSTLYGIVLDEEDDPLEDVEVTVNGVTVMTDIDGRYIAPDFSRMTSRASRTAGSKLYVSFSKAGYDTQRDDPNHSTASRRYQIADAGGAKDGIDFSDNDPQRLDIVLEESQLVATVTGTVTDKDGDPVAGVDLIVVNEDGDDVLHNRQWISAIGAYCTVGEGDAAKNCRRTGDDGTYEMQVQVTDDDHDYTITPSKNRYYFDNTDETERLEAGDSEDGVDFEALRQSRIRGAVKDADDNGIAGVTVTATARDRTPTYAPTDETNDNGRFTIWVDGDERYDVSAMKDGYSFTDPEDEDNLGLRVDDDETHDVGTFTAAAVPDDVNTLASLTVQYADLDPEFDMDEDEYTAEVGFNVTQTQVAATATSSAAMVKIAAGEQADSATGSASLDVELEVGDTEVTITVMPADTTADAMTYTVTVTRAADQPGAPRNLKITSQGNAAVTLTWQVPSNIADLTGYEFRTSGGSWSTTDVVVTASGGSVPITTGLQNGVDETFWVRTVPGGDSASVTGAPWPVISSVAFGPTSIAENDDPDTDGAQDSTLVTITVGEVAYADFDVMLAVDDDDQAGLLTFPARATVRRGQTTATVVAMAVDNAIDASAADATVTDPIVVLKAKMVPAEAAERDSVVTSPGVTITDDDTAPTAPTALVATQVGSTDTFELTWTFVNTQWGTADGGRKFQYRVKNAAFTETDADEALWTDVAGGAAARSVQTTLAEPNTGTVTYNIEVRAVSDAGNGAAVTGTEDRTAS